MIDIIILILSLLFFVATFVYQIVFGVFGLRFSYKTMKKIGLFLSIMDLTLAMLMLYTSFSWSGFKIMLIASFAAFIQMLIFHLEEQETKEHI